MSDYDRPVKLNRDKIARSFDLEPEDLRRPDSLVAAAQEARDQFEKRRDEIAAAAESLMPTIIVEAAMLTGIELSEIADYEIDFDAGKINIQLRPAAELIEFTVVASPTPGPFPI